MAEKEQPEIVYTLKGEVEALQSIQDWVNKNFKDKHCPNCQSTKWIIPNRFLELRSFTETERGPVYPFIVLICSDCSHALLFNAVVGKLVKGSV